MQQTNSGTRFIAYGT